MRSLLHIMLGILLGVAGRFAYDFYEEGEQGKKGLRRAWVPADPATARAAPAATGGADVKPGAGGPAAKPVAPPSATKPAATKPAAQGGGAPALPPSGPDFSRRLAAEWWRWPETVTVRREQKIRFSPPGGGSVEFPIAAGAMVRVHRMDVSGTRLFVFAKGSPFDFPILLAAADTDFLARARPEGTPRPARPVARPAAPARPASSGRQATPPDALPAGDGDGLTLPPPPQPDGPAPTFFGVPVH
jgi:hypothetical protein